MRRTLPRVLGVSAVLGIGAVVASSGTPACVTQQCDGSFATFGFINEGHAIDEDTWESTPIDGTWLDYEGQRTWLFCPKQLGPSRFPTSVSVYVSTDANPNQGVRAGEPPRANSTTASGNLGEYAVVLAPDTDPNCKGYYLIRVTNDTCGDYFVRVVVRVGPAPADAGPDALPPTDAETDAPADVTPNGG